MKKILLLVSLIALSFLVTGITHAGEVTGNLEVSVNIVAACTVTTSPVNFGDTEGVDYTLATGDVTVNCSDGTPYSIALNEGLHYQGTRRILMSGSHVLEYDLFQNLTIHEPWGNACTTNTFPWYCVDDMGTGSDQSHPVYGMINPFSGIPGGTVMTDTVTVTVLY